MVHNMNHDMIQPPHYLLTGGTGFFGRALLQYWGDCFLAQHPTPTVTLLSRAPDAFLRQAPNLAQQPWLRLVQGDICDAASLPQGVAFTHILHAAADSTLGPRLTPLQRYDQIVNGTRNLLSLAVQCQAQRFLLTSSGGVYGNQPNPANPATNAANANIGVREDWHGMPDPLNPAHAYGVAKRAAEHLCALYQEQFGLPTVIARCFAFVGPDLPLEVHFAIGNFIRDALWRDAITVAGDGMAMRSYLDQHDLAHWLHTLLHHGHAGQAYNVGSDQAISIADLATLVRDTLAPNKPVQILGTPDPTRLRHVYVPNIDKIQRDLDVHITISLADSIRHTGRLAQQRATTHSTTKRVST